MSAVEMGSIARILGFFFKQIGALFPILGLSQIFSNYKVIFQFSFIISFHYGILFPSLYPTLLYQNNTLTIKNVAGRQFESNLPFTVNWYQSAMV